MRMNVNHPSFVTFMETVNTSILGNVKSDKYFGFTSEKKLSVQYLTLKLIYQTVKVRAKLTNEELLMFSKILLKKNEELENYEFAAILKDLIGNFDRVYEMTTSTPKTRTKSVKTDKSGDNKTES